MALIVEDGTGLATAEAYGSVADADAYWSVHGAPAAWTGASTGTKEAALRIASEWIDSRYDGRFQGNRVQPLTQRLQFPRYGVWADDAELPSNPLPRRLKEATYELAKRHIDQTALGSSLAADVEDGALSSYSVSLGAISESKTYLGGKPTLKKFTLPERLIAPLLAAQGPIERA